MLQRYLDPRAVAIVAGDRMATQAVLQETWDHIFFTGGKYVGTMVAEAAAKHLTPCVLELGGKSPCVVDRSASLDVAARRICWGMFQNAGQTCVRPDYLLVDETVADAFLRALRAEIAAFYGPDASQSPYYGRVVNDRAFDRVAALVADARESGAAVHGGATDKATRYVEPTLVDFGSDAAAFEGGQFSTLEEDDVLKNHAFEKGDLLLFLSHKYHCVAPVDAGERRVFVAEIWEGEARDCAGRCVQPAGAVCVSCGAFTGARA